MANHSFRYKGHEVDIAVDLNGDEGWIWSYSIDGKPVIRGPRHAFPAQARPLDEAVDHAKETIDEDERMRSQSHS